MFLGSRVQLVRRADKLTAIYEPIVSTMWDPFTFTSKIYTILFIFILTSLQWGSYINFNHS
jgi:hypothetical protein